MQREWLILIRMGTNKFHELTDAEIANLKDENSRYD